MCCFKAWGGNYFISGGDVDGGKILGKYPDTLDTSGELVFKPGIVIPTTPWESIWNGIAQWMGVTNASDLNEVLPNRNSFPNLFSRSTIYSGTDPPNPPTPSPTFDGLCEDDSNFSFPLDNGAVRKCSWLTFNENRASARLEKYCVRPYVGSACRLSCGFCTSSCSDDTTFSFRLKNGRKKKCRWLTINEKRAPIRIGEYCEQSIVSNACARSCDSCP